MNKTQMNRNAAATIDAAMTSDKEDLARFVGRSNVGSAYEKMCHISVMVYVNYLNCWEVLRA